MDKTTDDLSSFDSLRETMELLRSPEDGCPWDREQTHRSLRPNLLEECYEALEAIDRGDPQELAEELGDLLIQIVFHAQIGAEEGTFTMGAVIRSINEKIRRRHPHVFGDAQVADSAEVKVNWDRIKRQERPERSILEGVPRELPALTYSQAVRERAARAGFDWDDVQGVLEKVIEELRELPKLHSSEERERELGDVLFSIVNIARWMDIPAEEALREANHRFSERFIHMERLCRQRGLDLAELSATEKDKLWEEAEAALGR